MSLGIAGVQARVYEIQSRFVAPAPPPAPTTTSRVSGSGFQAALARELGATSPSAPTSAGGTATGERVIAAAKRYLGVPYLWGGTDPSKGLDCSGFVQLVFREFGIELPRVSRDQARAGRPVESLDQARPGDLVAFNSPVDHIGIYMGGGKMIVAPHSGEVVRIEDIGNRQPTAIRRVLPDEPVASVQGTPAPFRALFEAAGARHGVSPAVLEAVARAESGFNTRAVSSAGALGLMQIMPGTAHGLGVDPLDPAQAIDGAARLLAGHVDRFGSLELALAAYNAGPGAVERHGGIPPYDETRTYVQRVLSYLQEAS